MTLIHRCKKSFTLAEVLITLGIIGIVAEVTIPTLYNSIQDQQFKTMWKKEFSVLSQISLSIVNENSTLSICPYDGTDSARLCMRNAFLGYLKAVKTCDATNGALCFHINNDGTKFLNNTLVTDYWGATTSAILADGALLRFAVGSSDCSNISTECGEIWVDVNGFNKPNIVGKDIFGVKIVNNTLKPFGTQGDTYSVAGRTCIQGSTATSNRGEPCSLLFLYQ